MSIGWWIGIGCIFVVLLVVAIRLRKSKRRFVQSGLRHPTGFLKYHPDTQTKIKRALESDKQSDRSVAVLHFKGDLRASERHSLSRVIDEVILNKEKISEVVLNIESPGGSVADYGHAYAEICRLREADLKLTVCIDTVAASGGYLMALPATQILAAPFATVGSIGVVSFIPNIRKLLEKLNIEPRTFTAGDYKRTVTLTDNATPEQIERYKEQLNLVHEQFKIALKKHRPEVELSTVATGEAWLASTTLEKDLKLVDKIGVSSSYLLELNKLYDLVEFSETSKKGMLSKWVQFFSELRANLGT